MVQCTVQHQRKPWSPADGGGIGAGSTQFNLLHPGANRALALVDMLRWSPESSGSGVGNAVDLNSIRLALIERVDVLTVGVEPITTIRARNIQTQ